MLRTPAACLCGFDIQEEAPIVWTVGAGCSLSSNDGGYITERTFVLEFGRLLAGISNESLDHVLKLLCSYVINCQTTSGI